MKKSPTYPKYEMASKILAFALLLPAGRHKADI